MIKNKRKKNNYEYLETIFMKFALRFICVDIGCIGIIILFKISFYKF